MKKILVLMFVLVLFVRCGKKGCTDPYAKNYDPEATKDDGSSCERLVFGDTVQGGIYFYGFGNYYVAAPQDQGTAEWGCYGSLITYTLNPGPQSGLEIGVGPQATIDIVNGCPTPGTAAYICANLTLGGYSDWFLPSGKLLHEMYLNIGPNNQGQNMGNFNVGPNEYYWSARQHAWNMAEARKFDWNIYPTALFPRNGDFYKFKDSNRRVRAVREITFPL